jgi:hypothetical protein
MRCCVYCCRGLRLRDGSEFCGDNGSVRYDSNRSLGQNRNRRLNRSHRINRGYRVLRNLSDALLFEDCILCRNGGFEDFIGKNFSGKSGEGEAFGLRVTLCVPVRVGGPLRLWSLTVAVTVAVLNVDELVLNYSFVDCVLSLLSRGDQYLRTGGDGREVVRLCGEGGKEGKGEDTSGSGSGDYFFHDHLLSVVSVTYVVGVAYEKSLTGLWTKVNPLSEDRG